MCAFLICFKLLFAFIEKEKKNIHTHWLTIVSLLLFGCWSRSLTHCGVQVCVCVCCCVDTHWIGVICVLFVQCYSYLTLRVKLSTATTGVRIHRTPQQRRVRSAWMHPVVVRTLFRLLIQHAWKAQQLGKYRTQLFSHMHVNSCYLSVVGRHSGKMCIWNEIEKEKNSQINGTVRRIFKKGKKKKKVKIPQQC